MENNLFELLKQLAAKQEIHHLDQITLEIFSDGSGAVRRVEWRGDDLPGNLFVFANEAELIKRLQEILSPKS